MLENKNNVIKSFLPVIQQTRAGSSVESLEFHEDQDNGYDWVFIKFSNGYKKAVDVTCDSEIAMLEDVIKALY